MMSIARNCKLRMSIVIRNSKILMDKQMIGTHFKNTIPSLYLDLYVLGDDASMS